MFSCATRFLQGSKRGNLAQQFMGDFGMVDGMGRFHDAVEIQVGDPIAAVHCPRVNVVHVDGAPESGDGRPQPDNVLPSVHETKRYMMYRNLSIQTVSDIETKSLLNSYMSRINERLRAARKAAGFKSASAFARSLGIEEATYRHRENGTREIDAGQLATYAKALGCDLSWLITGKGAGQDLGSVNHGVLFVPHISWVQAGAFTFSGDPKMLDDAEEFFPIPYHRKSLFALTVKGNSMNKVAPEGSIIIVDYDDKTLVDQLLYIFEADGELTFKRLHKKGAEKWLLPDSTEKMEPIRSKKPLRVVGRVVFVIKRT